jgi:beta-glucosidase/6-phospho-beta-glucosidase/beta-galactosidase/lysophospholipase L1-like esterase
MPLDWQDMTRIFVGPRIDRIDLKRIDVVAPTDPTIEPATLARLQFHKTVLEAAGITDLSTLGVLNISGVVVPQKGILRPMPEIYESGPTMFQSAYRVRADGLSLEQIGGTARLLKTTHLPPLSLPIMPTLGTIVPRILTGTVTIDVAYWVGTWIELEDDTTIILKYPNQYLFIIAEKLKVGRNVTFTWEQTIDEGLPQKLPKPAKKPQAPTPDGLWGVTGEPGENGVNGGRGPDGKDAPELELWTLEMTGRPIFDLKGQDGFQGGPGQDGGDGGDGSKGRAAIPKVIDTPLGPVVYDPCASGPGNGGDGGPGGAGGNGGGGGNGGHGGRLFLYAPQSVLNAYTQGFTVTIEGGAAGPGGMPGTPGAGGAGGQVGDNPNNCSVSSPRTAGRPGAQGAPGVQGPSGMPGDRYSDAISMKVINADDFRRKLLSPALIRLSPVDAKQDDTIMATGLRFTSTDIVTVDGIVCTTNVINDQQLTFVVPAVEGGRKAVQVKQSDGTLSNRATLNILPVIQSVQPAGRLRPGTTVRLTGSGFATRSLIRVNGQDMPGVRFINSNTLEFELIRPASIVANPAGEAVTLQVVLPQGTVSNIINVLIDTYRILVLGDSVLWGQGLQDNQKIHSLVASAIRQREGNIGLYINVLAHSGAIIGVGDTTRQNPLDGEVPTSYPTILQQCDDFTDVPETIDLVIVDGGINDVDVRRILDLTISDNDLLALIEQHCHQSMKTLLERITSSSRYKKAKIIVTGYYPMLSEDSDLALLEAFIIGLGLTIAQITGGIIGAVVGPVLKDQLAKRCRFFVEQSEIKLQQAVDEVNHTLINNFSEAARRVFLAQPEFGKENAALASDRWIFGINLDLSPEDNLIAPSRRTACENAGSARTDVEVCKRASMGHPNERGAQEYAKEILALIYDQPFPANFLWGVATAGYQVEGNITNNDWHIFTTNPAITARVHTQASLVGLDINLAPASEAVRHGDLNVLIEDLERTKLLGMNAYRFSIEWSRIQPTQFGGFDQTALQYYDNAIAEMQKRGLKPIVTLNHLTLPSWVLIPPLNPTYPAILTDSGFMNSLRGWENPATVDAFNNFVSFIVGRYKNRVDTWITLNEPVGSMIGVGYIGGAWPPGFVLDGSRAKLAYFNLLKAHVRAYNTIKSLYGNQPSQVGIAHAMMYPRLTPAGGGIGNVNEAAKNQFHYFYNEHFLNSLIQDVVDTEIQRRPANRVNVPSQDFYGLPSGQAWTPKLDFIGLNYYRSVSVYYDQILAVSAGFSGGAFDNNLLDSTEAHNLLNDLGWEIYPKGLYHVLKWLHQQYNLPILITENGIPQSTDRNRASFIVAHLEQVLRAIKEGVRVDAYIHWSIVDNFEWHEHYRPAARFGLFNVDRDTTDANGNKTLPRHLTEGALALQYIIAENGIGQAVEKFGTITPRAYSITPPAKSAGATWEGTMANGVGFTLYLCRLTTGNKFLGMIFFQDTQRWHQLENIQWANATLRFSFTLRDGTRVNSQATASGGDLIGTFSGSSLAGVWQAKRLRPCGAWRSNSGFPPVIALSRMEGDFDQWRGKFLGVYPRQEWVVNDPTTLDGSIVKLGFGTYGSFAGTLSASTGIISGTITLVGAGGGATTAWDAKRLPDDVPF